jgi:peptidoglycan/xylan/chitin deacetylase (PgdA/CDA1 family)
MEESSVHPRKRPLLVRLARANPRVLYYVATREKIAALTIDDSPHREVTPRILDLLRTHEVKATFFVLGANVKGNEDLVERMLEEGHELGNHLLRDYPSILLSSREFERQLLEVDELLPEGTSPKWFRPGSGWFRGRMLELVEKRGYRCVLGSVYPQDTKLRNVRLIRRYITRKIFPGSILILHDGKRNRIRTVAVLRHAIPELKQRGYRLTTLSELVCHAAT